MPVSANLDAVLDKEWENKSLEEILKAPVSALAGVSDTAAAAWQQAFNVKTVGDLGRNKFFRAAQALALLAESTGKQ
jgi:phage terminase Nu1 subunit (DNA packaging protein)